MYHILLGFLQSRMGVIDFENILQKYLVQIIAKKLQRHLLWGSVDPLLYFWLASEGQCLRQSS